MGTASTSCLSEKSFRLRTSKTVPAFGHRGESSKSAEPEPLGFRGESAILFYVGAGPQNWASAAGRETGFALPGLMLQVALNPLCDMAGYALVPLQQRSREPEVVWKTKQSSRRRRPQ